jgi:hypothetical protein
MSGHRAVDRHGKNKKRRPGVHKHAASPETLRWNREQLLPERPPWMSAESYQKLAQLRGEL